MPDRIDAARVQAGLAAPVAGPVVWVCETGSTNDLIAVRARQGAPEGLVIGADHQTRGRGRRGRAWEERPGDAVLVSVLLRPDADVVDPGLLPIVAAVGVADGLAGIGVRTGLVWPNDLSVDGRKLGGILCELASSGRRLAYAVVGVGINVRTSPRLESGRWEPTSVADVLGGPVSREAVLAAALHGLGSWVGRWYADGAPPVLEAYASYDALRGRRVRVCVGERGHEGIADGLGPAGALRLRGPDGAVTEIASGEVTGVDALSNS